MKLQDPKSRFLAYGDIFGQAQTNLSLGKIYTFDGVMT